MGSITQEVVVLNDFGLEERRRTTGSGTTNRYTVTIKADPIVHVFDPKELGRGPAEAIAEAIRKGIRAIQQTASPSTILRRKSAEIALNKMEPWALRRYAGGRSGIKAPARSDKLFNDSGRLADGIVAGANDEGWTVNVTANRLDPSTFNGGVGAMATMHERLRSLVPALRSAAELLQDEGVKAAIDDSIYDILVVKGGNVRRIGRRGLLQNLKTVGSLAWRTAQEIGLTR